MAFTVSQQPTLIAPVNNNMFNVVYPSSSASGSPNYSMVFSLHDYATTTNTFNNAVKVYPSVYGGNGVWDSHNILKNRVSFDINCLQSMSLEQPSTGSLYRYGIDIAETSGSQLLTKYVSLITGYVINASIEPDTLFNYNIYNLSSTSSLFLSDWQGPRYVRPSDIATLTYFNYGALSASHIKGHRLNVYDKNGTIYNFTNVNSTASVPNTTHIDNFGAGPADLAKTTWITGSNVSATPSITNPLYCEVSGVIYGDAYQRIDGFGAASTIKITYNTGHASSSFNLSGSNDDQMVQLVREINNENYMSASYIPSVYYSSVVELKIPASLNGLVTNWQYSGYFIRLTSPVISFNVTYPVHLNPYKYTLQTFDINTSGSSEIVTFMIDDNCTLQDEYELIWLNRLGSFSQYTFYREAHDNKIIKKDIYRKNNYQYNTNGTITTPSYLRGETILSIDSNNSYTVKSKVLDDLMSQNLSTIFDSKEVFMRKDGKTYPVIIEDGTYETMKSRNTNTNPSGRIIYTLTFRLANRNII